MNGELPPIRRREDIIRSRRRILEPFAGRRSRSATLRRKVLEGSVTEAKAVQRVKLIRRGAEVRKQPFSVAARPEIRIANFWLRDVAGFRKGDRYAATSPRPGTLVIQIVKVAQIAFDVEPAPKQTVLENDPWKREPCPVCGKPTTQRSPGRQAHERGTRHLLALQEKKAEEERAIRAALKALPG